jgi:hypothetical protein
MNNAGVETAFGDLDFTDQAVFGVEQQGEKNLFAVITQAFVKMVEGVGGTPIGLPRLQALVGKAPGDLEQRLDFRRFGRADAGLLAEFSDGGGGQPAQGTKTPQ